VGGIIIAPGGLLGRGVRKFATLAFMKITSTKKDRTFSGRPRKVKKERAPKERRRGEGTYDLRADTGGWGVVGK